MASRGTHKHARNSQRALPTSATSPPLIPPVVADPESRTGCEPATGAAAAVAAAEQYLNLESFEVLENLLDLCGATLDARALPLLRGRLHDEEDALPRLQAHGYTRMVEKCAQLVASLAALIAILEQTEEVGEMAGVAAGTAETAELEHVDPAQHHQHAVRSKRSKRPVHRKGAPE